MISAVLNGAYFFASCALSAASFMNMAIRCFLVKRLAPARNCPVVIALLAFIFASNSQAQSPLSIKWEELTAPDFVKAIQQSQGTCLLPIVILEKHGAHLPLGNDLINVRYLSEHAAGQEYAVVFPAYYFGQIFEARHQPGTVAYSSHMQLDLLQETTDEMGRDGCK